MSATSLREPVVIIGNGMAAAKFCEELTALAPERFALTVVGAEPHLAYNRVLLSSLLAGEVVADDLVLKDAGWWAARGIELKLGTAVTAVDTAAREVRLADGSVLGYGRLVLATGSSAIRLPLPGMELPGVMTFRDMADVGALLAAARPGLRAIVIGGGLLGLEAATGLAGAGADTAIIHLADRLMERQLDARAAGLLRQAVEARGIAVHLDAATQAIEGTGRVEGLRLADGRVLPADLVVVACGVKPNADLARAAGIGCGRGVRVDDHLATDAPGVFAIGECAEHRGQVYGLVEPAYEQARVLARRLAGTLSAYAGSVLATNLKVSGVHVFSAGDFLGGAGTQELVLADPGLGLYRRLVLRADGSATRLVGAVLFGDTADGLFYLDLMRSGRDIGAARAALAFGRAYLAPDLSTQSLPEAA
ncbi:NAD(P)/FAD-dependent oxidoreductase [Ancylobacter defluvii]|uniref:Pyridine nucleotide-disulfide oxidoreductase n=1 Tax=Ancylobacter defluvii TaxID=1282440 RepID=A0A9W6NA97_9HYPH|nr:FAD-dependent oxidoreductase [Ancylobacter defluvii]MBS7590506.1 NAD(P)/FAD-dependent oxidoreductase [Ancylobacter defluvii]GLK83428.1 pyridine nucleotide-disulfide oxidoreductase [Ancylobacter defluvii]